MRMKLTLFVTRYLGLLDILNFCSSKQVDCKKHNYRTLYMLPIGFVSLLKNEFFNTCRSIVHKTKVGKVKVPEYYPHLKNGK